MSIAKLDEQQPVPHALLHRQVGDLLHVLAVDLAVRDDRAQQHRVGGVLDGGVDALLPDQTTYLTLDLEPGHYGYVSVEDANGPGMPAQHGEFDVS